MTTERETEALAAEVDVLGAILHQVAELQDSESCSVCAESRRRAVRILNSDWLADHDARIVAEAEARGAERAAQAIEVERARDVYQHPVGLTSEACYYEGARDAYDNAARIARAALADREEEA